MSPLKDFVYCCKQTQFQGSICLILSSGIGHVLFCQDFKSAQEIPFDQGQAEFDIAFVEKRKEKKNS